MVQLFALVVEAVAAATDALLSGDRQVADVLAGRDILVGNAYEDVARMVNRAVALEVRDQEELGALVGVLRVVPELERSHQLASHIARRAANGLGAELTPRARGLVDRMGKVGTTMWRQAADCWYDKQGEMAQELVRRDEEMDELHAVLMSEVASAGVSSSVAMEMALVARFYERIGDHAVNVARVLSVMHDRSGHDRSGHDRSGHDRSGHDRSGHDRSGRKGPRPAELLRSRGRRSLDADGEGG